MLVKVSHDGLSVYLHLEPMFAVLAIERLTLPYRLPLIIPRRSRN